MLNFVINLDRRPDRWVVVREEMHSHGFSVIRHTAIDRKPGWMGCRDSHLAILEQCKNDSVFVIFEDDVQFLWDNPQEFIQNAIDDLPLDWDCLYLGASPQEPLERYSDNLFRLKNAWCMHAVMWHNRPNGAIDWILSHKDDIQKIDVYMANEIMPKFNCFLSSPMICNQRVTNYSDTCKRSDVTTILKNYNKYCI